LPSREDQAGGVLTKTGRGSRADARDAATARGGRRDADATNGIAHRTLRSDCEVVEDHAHRHSRLGRRCDRSPQDDVRRP